MVVSSIVENLKKFANSLSEDVAFPSSSFFRRLSDERAYGPFFHEGPFFEMKPSRIKSMLVYRVFNNKK